MNELNPVALDQPALQHTVPPAGPGRWHPAPLVQASFALHALALPVLLLQPGEWPWVLGALLANHLLLSTAVLFPRGRLLGPNMVRLPAAAVARGEVALTFDDGPDQQVTPQVLALLEARGLKASFFCVGAKAAAHPDLLREIVRRGHSVENHSQRHHPAFAFFGYAGLAREVDAAQAAIAGITGRAPQFFRAPAGFRSPMLDPVLARRGLHYTSWTRRGFDAVERDPAKVLARLTCDLAAGDVLLLHDGGAARTRDGVPLVLAVLPALLERIAAHGFQPVTLPAACGEQAVTERAG